MRGRLVVSGNFLAQPLTGVQRHAWEIATRLLDTDLRPTIAVSETLRIAPEYGAWIERHVQRLGRGGGHIWQQTVLPRYVNRSDLLWTPSGLGSLAVGRQVITMHDISVLEHPEWFSPAYGALYRLCLPRSLRRALHVFTSSEFSRQRIVERIGLTPAQITPIASAVCAAMREPVSDAEARELRLRYNLPARFLLAVGSLEPRKNLRNLLAAAALLFDEFPDLRVVLVGGRMDIFKSVDLGPFAVGRVMMLGQVADADLRGIYRAADLFVYPSLYEGFGIPPLEAMSCGTPVVASSATAVPEVVGEAAILVDPLDVKSIARGIRRVLVDSELRERLRRDGSARAASFDWDGSARTVYGVLKRFSEA